jgi:hypothetical protein
LGIRTPSKFSSAVPVDRSTIVSTGRASNGDSALSTRKSESPPSQVGL